MDYPRIARRTFLGAAAVASLAPVKSFLHAEDKKKADEFGGFILGVQSYSFRNFKLEPALKKIQDLGLHYVEFYNGHVPVSSTPEQIKRFRRQGFQFFMAATETDLMASGAAQLLRPLGKTRCFSWGNGI